MFLRWSVLTLLVLPSAACFAEENEKQLLESLQAVPEVRLLSDEQMLADLDQKELVKKRLPRRARPGTSRTKSGNGKQLTQDIFLYQHNQQLHEALLAAAKREGLPVKITGAALPLREAVVMQTLSRELRAAGFVSFTASEQSPEETAMAFKKWSAANHIEKFAGVPGTLVQMMQVEEEPIRLEMIGQLNKIGSAKASAALAKRALFDSSAEVREAAVAALKKRPPEEYVPVLLKGFRHPWPAVAEHAANALAKLKPPETESALVQMLDKIDPRAPVRDPKTKKLMVSEMVRINHLRNCFLCHAASAGEGDGLLVASVPEPPRPVQKGKKQGQLIRNDSQQKRMDSKGKLARSMTDSYYGPPVEDTIRADLTFLRQDFSAMLKSKDGKPERFDFFIRTRPAKPEDWLGLSDNEMDYPQRKSLLKALRKITGKDGGDSPGQWRELLGITTREK
jgi:hypothetical protein